VPFPGSVPELLECKRSRKASLSRRSRFEIVEVSRYLASQMGHSGGDLHDGREAGHGLDRL
jgi:hypothetical protein